MATQLIKSEKIACVWGLVDVSLISMQVYGSPL